MVSLSGRKESLLAQLIKVIENFIFSGKIRIIPPFLNQDDVRQRILIMLNMNKVVQHIWDAISLDNVHAMTPVFDNDYPM